MTPTKFREACKHLAEKDKRFKWIWYDEPCLMSDEMENEFDFGPAGNCTQDSLDELAGMLGWEYFIFRDTQVKPYSKINVVCIKLDGSDAFWPAGSWEDKPTAALEAATAIIYQVFPLEVK